jgi:hypothetical protein
MVLAFSLVDFLHGNGLGDDFERPFIGEKKVTADRKSNPIITAREVWYADQLFDQMDDFDFYLVDDTIVYSFDSNGTKPFRSATIKYGDNP